MGRGGHTATRDKCRSVSGFIERGRGSDKDPIRASHRLDQSLVVKRAKSGSRLCTVRAIRGDAQTRQVTFNARMMGRPGFWYEWAPYKRIPVVIAPRDT